MSDQLATGRDLMGFDNARGVRFTQLLVKQWKLNVAGGNPPRSEADDFVTLVIPASEIPTAPAQVSFESLLINLRYESAEQLLNSYGYSVQKVNSMIEELKEKCAELRSEE